MRRTGFLYDPRFLEHKTRSGHPECPERLERTLAYLQKLPWFKNLLPVQTRRAQNEWIQKIHSTGYALRAKQTCEKNQPILDTPDVCVSRQSYEVALLACGGALQLADAMISGKIENGFGLLRPPGHHAEKEFAMGFCLFNNIAILARYLQIKHTLEKILILDWDVHHGNGTQHTFEEDPSVLYISLHQYPFYPGSGALWETGAGKGKGATLNCPVRAGSDNAVYEEAFRTRILPKIDSFKPDAILISAGFDAHDQDPLADIRLTSDFFGWMSLRMMEVAAKYAGGRLLSLLEGGYNLDVLPECVAKHLEVLTGKNG